MLFRFQLTHCHPVPTPAKDAASLDKYSADKHPYDEKVAAANIKKFQQIIGSYLYLANTMQFDIAYTVNRLA